MTRRKLTPDAPTLRLREPTDVLAAIPYVVGYHPAQSVVVLAMCGTELLFAARDDLPDPDAPESPYLQGAHLVQIMEREGADAVILVGFGADDAVRPVVLAIRDVCEDAGLHVLELLRADGGRYWSYLCRDPGCCPADGCAYDTATSTVAAHWTLAGRVALPDRETYEGQLDPVDGTSRLAMAKATARAGDRLFDLVISPIDDRKLEQAMLRCARDLVHDALVGPRAGQPLDDDDLAWLSVLLSADAVLDAAWEQIGAAPPQAADALRLLWLDVMRRTAPELRAGPSALFAYAAWRCGDSHLARVAVDRALELEPDLAPARQLRRALNRGLAPGNLSQPERRSRRARRAGRRPRRRSSSGRAGNQPG